MSKEKLTTLFKSKGFYLSLLTGVLAVFAICFVVLNTTSVKKQNNGGTDLAKMSSEETEKTKNTGKEANSNAAKNETAQPDKQTNIKNNTKDTKQATTKKDESVAVTKQDNAKVNANLKFNEEKGLAWPVKGNVLMKYSMDRGVYFATLGQYKCNPAIIIDAKVGDPVKSAAAGKITSITKDEETGLTVTMDIGNNYKLVYGQLQKLQVKKGDIVKEGQKIGTVAQPTKYYVVEGGNLYFKVLEHEETVNPMLLLR
ncbi:stage II sporulation protein related to metaloproteases [Lachnospiraceae bacterium KM106-2]|nr:stage II sporulation protein related to metaloproteases [Lachnospiraceae bacterium KM106-2]